MDIGKLLELTKYADDFAIVYMGIVLVASVVVKFTKTLKDDTVLLAIIKFLSKWIALNRTVKDKEIRKELQKRIDKDNKG